MSYEIVRNMAEMPVETGGAPKSKEREAMERLCVGDGFWVEDAEAMQRARWTRAKLAPKKFTVRKVSRRGWQVRRVT